MSKITKHDVAEAEELKQKIEDALAELKQLAYKADHHIESRFNAYVVGPIENALDDISGIGNSSIQDFIESLEEESQINEDDDDSVSDYEEDNPLEENALY